jgi:hypothetical protein
MTRIVSITSLWLFSVAMVSHASADCRSDYDNCRRQAYIRSGGDLSGFCEPVLDMCENKERYDALERERQRNAELERERQRIEYERTHCVNPKFDCPR